MNVTDSPLPPQLEFTLELRVDIGPPIELGTSCFGIRRTVPITGGTFSGPHISGRVLAGGADWQFVENDGLTFVDARYAVETSDGVRIEVHNQGVRHGTPEVLARIAAGERVAPEEYYFRTGPRFYSPEGRYEWLKRSVFIGTCERYEELVVVRVWRVA
jgi:Protein of unknown function (DUF3237)